MGADEMVPGRSVRIVIFATHPIQYQVPWFRALAADPALDVQVYYAMLPDAVQQGVGFGVEFEWDLPLLDGYAWRLLENRSAHPALDKFRGCDVPGLKELLSTDRADVALITGWNSMYLLQALFACRRMRVPSLVRGESNVLAPRGPVKRWLQRSLLRRYSAFLTVGELNRRLYEQAGISHERIFHSLYFVDNERFSRQADSYRSRRLELRQHWKIAENAACFLFVGKLIPKKRVMDFLQAIESAGRQGAPVSGLVVGAGEQMTEARSYVESRQLPVTFTGFLNQSEIGAAYALADCLVLPSDHRETWGLVVNEAMACGIPALVSDQVGCGPDLVVRGETGEIFALGDIKELTDVIKRLAQDPDQLRDMGNAARKLVGKSFSVARAVEGTKQAIAWVLTQRATH